MVISSLLTFMFECVCVCVYTRVIGCGCTCLHMHIEARDHPWVLSLTYHLPRLLRQDFSLACTSPHRPAILSNQVSWIQISPPFQCLDYRYVQLKITFYVNSEGSDLHPHACMPTSLLSELSSQAALC